MSFSKCPKVEVTEHPANTCHCFDCGKETKATFPEGVNDNNESERSIRMAKLKQKISGCFRSKVGSDVFYRIHTYLITAKKQNKNLFQAIKNALEKEIIDTYMMAE